MGQVISNIFKVAEEEERPNESQFLFPEPTITATRIHDPLEYSPGLRYLLRDSTTDEYPGSDPPILFRSNLDALEEKERFFLLITELINSFGVHNQNPNPNPNPNPDPEPCNRTWHPDHLIFPAEELQEEVLTCSASSSSVNSERIEYLIGNSVGGEYLDPCSGVGSGSEEGERWLNHYNSCQRILLVGEGDFSFSASLALAFGSASDVVATSLNSESFLRENYRNAMSNIQRLRSRGAKVLHGVDATEMATHSFLRGLKFDRIVFNFPHAGFFPNESTETQLQRHRELVRLFMRNAKKMVGRGGQIHITHKSNGFFQEWKLEELGLSEGLKLIEEVPFKHSDYPGYRTMYGFGGDKNFYCYPCNTYKFGLKRRSTRRRRGRKEKKY